MFSLKSNLWYSVIVPFVLLHHVLLSCCVLRGFVALVFHSLLLCSADAGRPSLRAGGGAGVLAVCPVNLAVL